VRCKSLLLTVLVACRDAGDPPISDTEPEAPAKELTKVYRR
jgi:hypothetical protein